MVQKKKSKKKPSAAQLRARAKFTKIMKSGGFGRRKAAKKKVVRGKRTTAKQPRKSRVKPRTTKRSRGGSASDVNKTLLLNDINRLPTSKKNKMKIVKSIANRLGIWNVN